MPAQSQAFTFNTEVNGFTGVSGAVSVHTEVNGLTAVSAANVINTEVNGFTGVSSAKVLNTEVSEALVIGGEPDSGLNLPTFALASRLRADLYGLNVECTPPARTIEYIGSKLGTAPVLSIADFSYTSKLDEIGDWEILVPANDERLAAVLDGTAKIIKIYYEDVGHVFTGFIDDYEIVDSETMRIVGTDLLDRLGNISSLWRIDTRNFKRGSSIKRWRDYYRELLLEYAQGMNFQFQTMPTRVIYTGDEEDFIGIVPAYESQSVLDILRDFNAASGVHFRIHPATGMLTIGEFGDDSELIIAPIQEDDPAVREQGALVLVSFDYQKTKEELTNMIVVQGSNDSFGIAVELRHSSHSLMEEIQFLSRGTGASPGVLTLPSSNDGTFYSLNVIPQDVLQAEYEDDLQSTPGTIGIPATQAWIGSDPLSATNASRKVAAIPFTPSQDFYLTFAAVMNMGGIGQVAMAVVPESGGNPDTSDVRDMRFLTTNYYQDRLPGNYVQLKAAEGTPGGFFVGNVPSREDREFGIISEVFGFMDLCDAGFNGLPWPKLLAGTNYYLLVWPYNSPTRTITGFDWAPGTPIQVHEGDTHSHLQLLCNIRDSGASGTAKYLNSSGGWDSSDDEIVMTIHGLPASSEYLYAVEGMLAEVVKENGSGHRVFFLRDFDSIQNYGLRQRSVSFSSAIDASEGVPDIIPAADLMHDQAQVYLENHSEPFEKLTVTCTGLFRLPFVGQQVRFVYRGMALNENGEYKWLDINSLWTVLDINWHINNEGLEHTLTLTNVPDDLVNTRNITREFARHMARSKNNLGEIRIASHRLGDGIQALT